MLQVSLEKWNPSSCAKNKSLWTACVLYMKVPARQGKLCFYTWWYTPYSYRQTIMLRWNCEFIYNTTLYLQVTHNSLMSQTLTCPTGALNVSTARAFFIDPLSLSSRFATLVSRIGELRRRHGMRTGECNETGCLWGKSIIEPEQSVPVRWRGRLGRGSTRTPLLQGNKSYVRHRVNGW